ncbi:MAG TPA: RNA polymerase sigma factor [Verrucomicrobiae bacterium]
MGESDDEIQNRIAQSRNGDHAAFADVIRAYQQMVHSLTYRMTGSAADAQDLAQETFIRAYQQLHTFNGTSKFSSWLYRIAVNACLDWRRSEQRRQRLQADWSDAHITADGGLELPTDEISREVQAALMKLPDKQRAAIVLTTFGGLNHAAAAKTLRCSETTVSWRIFAARRRLKKLLQPRRPA